MVIEVTDFKVGTSYAMQEVYFSGGLRGSLTDHGWVIYPISDDTNGDAFLFRDPRSHYKFAVEECGLQFVGVCVQYQMGVNEPPMEVWESGRRDLGRSLNAADSWKAVSHQAAVAGDKEYSRLASYLSVCLKIAGLRLRDVSRRYHDQLRWALYGQKKVGGWFSNAAMLDLYADFHSLLSELSSARDHLARIAAIHGGAPEKVDSLARLEEWLSKANNSSQASEPLIVLLLSASGTKEQPCWLRRLGDIRNEMLHRIPMGANKSVSFLTLEEIETSMGNIKKIRLGEPSSEMPLSKQAPDPLVELSELSSNLEVLCSAAWKLAKYKAEPPRFEAKSTSGI
ncbi:hypothetical protein LNN38_25445 [Pseudomonas sp. LA21]|uniref:hypothetical protein n=1 Tax=Pseudomonas sp. LA21 TaxID=2893373 RepID=UPI001FB81C35|nr:hypothetical protein [Pseudomonas sp. LA21]MCJ1888223.1 hypothetical protein [Pseudomonas sp. LA21]